MPNVDLIKEWIKALRSNEYNQTRGALQDDYGYCCLGVLCEIDHYTTKRRIPFQSGKTTYTYSTKNNDFESSCSQLPTGLMVRLGILGDGQAMLIDMNDHGRSFQYIADWIENTAIKNLDTNYWKGD